MQNSAENAQQDGEVRKSLKDSQGNMLSEAQQEFFKDSVVRDNDGNLLVVYHGTNAEFTVFDKKKSKYSNLYGRGFYFTDSDSHAQQYGNAAKYYLNIKNPLKTGARNITKDQVLRLLRAIENDGEEYDLYNYGAGATAETVLNTVWGKDDFSILQDISATAVGDFVETVALFNSVNGTDYDGIIPKSEFIAFYPNQIKRTDNLSPTESADIRFSLKSSVSTSLEQRVSGDALLNAQDLIEEIKNVGAEVDENGYVTVYHQTTNESANQIRQSGKMIAKEPYVYFSTSTNASQSDGRGTEKLELKVPAEILVLDDIFDDNADVKIALNGKNSLDISNYLVNAETKYPVSEDINTLKQMQLEIINESNPAPNAYNTWVRSIDDIKTFEEAVSDPEYADYDEFNPDFTRAMAEDALESGEITVYSSYPIKNGVFVTPSRMEAESYSGSGQVYEKTVSLSDVAWIDVTQGQYAEDDKKYSLKEYSEFSKNNYDYKSLVSKSDMLVTAVNDSAKYQPDKQTRKNIVKKAIKNAISVGKVNENGNPVVRVEDINIDVIVSKRSIIHGLDRRLEISAPIIEKVGNILQNSIIVNELNPKKEGVANSYITIGYAQSNDNDYIVRFVINRYSNEIETIDVLYAVNTKRNSRHTPGSHSKTALPTVPKISISDLLDFVNKYFPDILPEDVLRHYGHSERPSGKLGESALFSLKDTVRTQRDLL